MSLEPLNLRFERELFKKKLHEQRDKCKLDNRDDMFAFGLKACLHIIYYGGRMRYDTLSLLICSSNHFWSSFYRTALYEATLEATKSEETARLPFIQYGCPMDLMEVLHYKKTGLFLQMECQFTGVEEIKSLFPTEKVPVITLGKRKFNEAQERRKKQKCY